MPDRSRVAAFVSTVVGGEYVQAIADFYWDDASMQENTQPPRVGRAGLMAHETKALQGVTSIVTLPDPTVVIDGDQVAINWRFDITDLSGTTRRLDELALQRWRGDRIVEERFFYDPAWMRDLQR